MEPETEVVFTYDIHDRNTHSGESDSFKTLDDLKNAIAVGRKYYKMPYELNVTRTVQIVDNDLSQKKSGFLPQPKVLNREQFKFIVSERLVYPRHVREILRRDYGDAINFDSIQKWHNSIPVYFSGVDKKPAFLSNKYDLHCRAINKHDIIINSDLHEIWPESTKLPPVQLTKLLAKTTENQR